MLPTFIGLGPPKSGTTWLFRCLNEHPEVFLPAVKETHFFDADSIDGRLDEYEAYFAGAGDARAVGEITPWYFSSEVAPARIAAVVPNARLFASLRDPIDRINSNYWHLRRQNFHRADAAAKPIPIGEAIDRFPGLTAPCFYHRQVERWLAHVPRERLHIVFFQDITDRPADVMRGLYRFLDVDDTFVPAGLGETGDSVRRGVSPRSAIAGRVYGVIYHHLNRGVYMPLKRAIGLQRAERLKDALRVRQVMSRVFHRSGYPPVPGPVRARLVAMFREDIAALAELTGRDLSAWMRE